MLFYLIISLCGFFLNEILYCMHLFDIIVLTISLLILIEQILNIKKCDQSSNI